MPALAPIRSARGPALALLFLGAACSSPPPPIPSAHRHTATLTVTDAGLLPDARVAIPAFGTVLWRNRASMPMQVRIDAAVCNECDTVLGFAQEADGVRSTAVGPGEVVTICFHDRGTFAFAVHIADAVRTGTIHVGEQP